MVELTSAYLATDIKAFDAILHQCVRVAGPLRGASGTAVWYRAPRHSRLLHSNRRSSRELAADEFMRPFIADLLTSMRSQVLLTVVAPYSRVALARLGTELSASIAEVEELCVTAILDGKLGATLDQVAGTLTLTAPGQAARSATAAEAATAAAAHPAGVGASVEAVGMAQGKPGAGAARARAVNKFTEIERLAVALKSAITGLTAVEVASSREQHA